MPENKRHKRTPHDCRKVAALFILAGDDTARIARTYSANHGITESYVYELARRGGWKSGYDRRRDAGRMKLPNVTEAQMRQLQDIAVRPNVKTARDAITIAEEGGILPPGVVGSRYLRKYIIRKNGVGLQQLRNIAKIKRSAEKRGKVRP